MSFISFIEGIFPFLFKAAKRAYDKLSTEEQNALKHGSGVLDIINKEIDKTPAELRVIIQYKFPDLDEATLETGIFKLAKAFKIDTTDNSFDDVVEKIKAFLKSQEDKVWPGIIQSFATVFAIIVAPEGTVFAKIGMLMEYAYQKYIKK